MADIKIYGKLVNKTADGIIADSEQIKVDDTTVKEKFDSVSNEITNVKKSISNIGDTIADNIKSELSEKIETNTNNISSLQETMSSATSDISSIKSKLPSYAAKSVVDSLSETVSENSSNIASLTNKVENIKIETRKETVNSVSLNSLSNEAIYTVKNAKDSPDGETEGILTVSEMNGTDIKQVWNSSASESVRVGKFSSVTSEKASDFYVELNGSETHYTSNIVELSPGSIYTLRGYLRGHIVIPADTADPTSSTKIILNNVTVDSDIECAIDYEPAKSKLVIELPYDTINYVSAYPETMQSNADYSATILSENNLEILGMGTLAIRNNWEQSHGIKAKEVRIALSDKVNPGLDIQSNHDGIHGSSLVEISGGIFNLHDIPQSAIEAQNSDSTNGELKIYSGRFTITNAKFGISGAVSGRVEGLDTYLTFSNVSQPVRSKYLSNMSILSTVHISGANVTTKTPSAFFGNAQVWTKDSAGNITLLTESDGVYTAPGYAEPAVYIKGYFKNKSFRTTVNKTDFILDDAYIESSLNTPIFTYTPEKSRIAFKNEKDTAGDVIYGTNYIISSGSVDSIVASSGNISMNLDNPVYFSCSTLNSETSALLQGSEITIRGDGQKYFYSNKYCTRGTRLYIGADADDYTAGTAGNSDQIIYGGKFITRLSGKGAKGGITIYDKQKGDIHIESIAAEKEGFTNNSLGDVFVVSKGATVVVPGTITGKFVEYPVSLSANNKQTIEFPETEVKEYTITGDWIKLKDSDSFPSVDSITELIKNNSTRIYETLDSAESDLSKENFPVGTIVSIKSDGKSDNYSIDYDLYIVVYDTTNKKTFKKIEGGTGGSGTAGSVTLSVDELYIDGVRQNLDDTSFEANIGSKIEIVYNFVSALRPDSKGNVYFRIGGNLIQKTEYPDGSTLKLTYDTSNLSAGNYKASLYGVDISGTASERQTLSFEIGGLSISSTFDEENVITAGNDISVPIAITSANPELETTIHVEMDDSEIISQIISTDSTSLKIAGEHIKDGSHKLGIYLTNSKKTSNKLNFSIIAAKMGVIYVLTDNDVYTNAAGSRLDVAIRTIQKGQEKNSFSAKLVVKDKSGEIVQLNGKTENSYTFNYGKNILQLIGLNYVSNDATGSDDYTKYTLLLTVSSEDETATPAVKEFEVRITPNNYNISASTDGLLCWFDASGKSNNDDDKETWLDKSGNGVKATLGNFNWKSNGWLADDDGNTALTLNSGAYVELDIAPFATEPKELTVSIDFETTDILDSTAKVVSCLKETEGTDVITYYLRDAWGDYVKNDTNTSTIALDTSFNDETELADRDTAVNYILSGITNATEKAEKKVELDKMTDLELLDEYKKYKFKNVNNIIRYCMFSGEYCWINGVQYVADGKTPYDVTYSQSERTINYNKGEDDPDYSIEKKHYTKKTGKMAEQVTKQQGFYIDTQYGVLSNSSSKAAAEDKFHMNFSQDTRTKMDFVITRNGAVKPYFLSCMAGYVNGVISGIQEITEQDTFRQVDQNNRKFRVYLGGKGQYDSNNNLSISDTGSCKIYSFRIYEKALDHEQILKNYAAEIPDFEKKKSVIDNNGIVNKSSLANLPRICIMGANLNGRSTINDFIMQLANSSESQISDLKSMKEPAYISYTDPDNPDNSWKAADGTYIIPARLQFQGTSSLVYPMKNYKFKMYESLNISDTGVVTYGKKWKKDLLGAGIKESTFCIKVNYMDSSNVRNTGSANFIADYNEITGHTPAMDINPNVRTTVYGYPILLYYKEFPESQEEEQFLGVGCLNLDKSDTDSFGLDKKMKDTEGTEYNFGKAYYIEDDFGKDILHRTQKSDGTYEKITLWDDGDSVWKEYDALRNKDNLMVAAVSEKGYLRSVSNQSVSNTACFELKANSGASGAGGFGNYFIDSVANDVEPRYPDDGDIEDDEFTPYTQDIAKPLSDRTLNKSEMNELTFKQYKSPYFYHFQRLIKWVRNANKEEFIANLDKHFNRNYLMDYYLTILLLGGVDSLGKNLMVGTWGPENLLFTTTDESDPLAFTYELSDGTQVKLTPTKNKSSGSYEFAEDSDGKQLFYDENCYSRVTKEFINGNKNFVVTKTPGECIWYPMFYDIDTILGVDNSGQLLYDVDIELGDQLDDGTMVFNTADSYLWTKVKEYLGEKDASGNSLLSDRWSVLTSAGKFTYDNLVGTFYYKNIISKIPEYYYNRDCFTKYVHEGPDDTQIGSKSYLYCCHGDSYEHIKKWVKERIYYLNSMFGKVGTTNASLRFNYGNFDAAFKDTDDYYNNYAKLAADHPETYEYSTDPETNAEILTNKNTGIEIKPIEFNFKTYQPGYVGIRWFNGGQIHYQRISRNSTATIKGNVKTSGDAEVFIFGGENIKEIGDMSPYNAKQVDFRNLTKLNKLQLGSSEYSCVINKLDIGTSNTYLAELKLVRCGSLSSVDVSSCINLKSVDMTDSGITSISLPPTGGALESIAYSSAITSIDLQNFVNLTKIIAPSLNNLTRFVIKNCPKILGTKEAPNSTAWALLQQTYNTKGLTDIQVTTYGQVEPKVISDTITYFFPDKFYNYATASYIRGEINYTGKTIPTNYTKFSSAYPYLTITYSGIEDASEMFANYNNLNCISKMSVYTGTDNYGNKNYKDVYYWTDETNELQEKWHNDTMYTQYGADSTFSSIDRYYQQDGKYYRLLGIYDDNDLDIIRAEIKKHLSNFKRFTNLTGLFRNMDILDYLDPDTFNSIDISEADTTEMFAGCTKLKYFELPGDTVKNSKEVKYYNTDSETGEQTEVDKGEWDGILPPVETGKYVNPFTDEVMDESTSTYRKGMRRIGSGMFKNCQSVKVYIHKYSDERVFISSNAFQYNIYDPSTNATNYTYNRPVILFENSDEELLETTTEESYTNNDEEIKNILISDGKYFKADVNGNRVFNTANKYISIDSTDWLRDVYFGISSVSLNDSKLVSGLTVDYATRTDGKRIILTVSGAATSFNNNDASKYTNPLKIYSLTPGSLSNISGLISVEIPLPTFDCFDKTHPLFDSEKSIANIFTTKKYENSAEMKDVFPSSLKTIYICATPEIPELSFLNLTQVETIGISDDTIKIGPRAFSQAKSLKNFYISSKSDASPILGKYYLQKIDDEAFDGCTSLTAFTLPTSIVKGGLGNRCFRDNTSLSSFNFNNNENIEVIPEGFFIGDTLLTSVTGLTSKITRFEKECFANCKVLNILTDDYVPGADDNRVYTNSIAFASNTKNTKNFDYFENLEYIGDSAFMNVEDIVKSATSLRNTLLKFPKTIKYIGASAFAVSNTQAIGTGYTEFVWDGDYSTDFTELVIGSNAFSNIRTSWRVSSDADPINNCICIPLLFSIGASAFKFPGGSAQFEYALTKNPKETTNDINGVGDAWVASTKKIIYEYYGLFTDTENSPYYFYLLSSDTSNVDKSIYSGKAYIQNMGVEVSYVEIPVYTTFNNMKFKVVEILSGALDKSSNMGTIAFNAGSELELIEKNVLKSTNLSSIMYGSEYNVIPPTLTIETGNILHGTQWFTNLESDESAKGKYITLGKNVIGYVPDGSFDGTIDLTKGVDLSGNNVSKCNVVFDSAFENMQSVKFVNFGENIESIYSKAFSGTGLTTVTFPKKLKRIDEKAFFGCHFTKLTFPASLTYIGTDAFKEYDNSTEGVGSLASVDIQDGAVISGSLFTLQQDIATNTTISGMPSNANFTFKEIHIPSTMPGVIDSNFSQLIYMSQTTKIYLGTLEINNDPDDKNYNTYLCKNYPLYVHIETTNGDQSTTTVFEDEKSEGDEQLTNDNGEKIYCPKFYHDMCLTTRGFKKSYIETTEEYSVCPKGDFEGPATLYYVRKYPDAVANSGLDISDMKDGFTREDLLRIIAGYTSDVNSSLYNITLRKSDYEKIQRDIPMIGQAGKRVNFTSVII